MYVLIVHPKIFDYGDAGADWMCCSYVTPVICTVFEKN